jgi:rRNA maturation protein Nop10
MRHMIRVLFAISVILSSECSMPGQNALTNVPLRTSSGDRFGKVRRKALNTTLTVASVTLHFEGISVYDEHSGLYWWDIGTFDPATQAGSLPRMRFAVGHGQIVAFCAIGPSVRARPISLKFSTELEAQSFFEEEVRKIEANPRKFNPSSFQPIAVGLARSPDRFFSSREFGGPPADLSVISVRPSRVGWEVDLSREDGRRFALLLDTKFNPIR